VVVIGGGLAGVQAALDLAAAGARVHLVEATASLGGHMAQLDKTFPTNDCSMCILSPLLVEAARHPNIAVHTLSRVTSLEGGAGAFRVRIATGPRYVDAAKCTACGLCSQKCPVRVRSEFECGLGERAAIYTPFPQAVPSTYRIDPEVCRYLTEGKCGLCAKVCPPKAVDYTMRPALLEVEAGAVVVATGATEYDPSPLVELGWGASPDVITALQLERLLSASGPTGGRLVRPSDGAAPRRIAWVHCAGSRDVHRVPYCSRVCCMYSAKQAVVAAEHAAAEGALERLDLFHIDLRAQGKGFHEYVERAAEGGRLRLVRARVAEVAPDGKGRLAVLHDDPHGGGAREDAYDLVVLAVPLVARSDASELAGVLGVDVDPHGFVTVPDPVGRPGETSRPGVLVAGMASGPRDITDTVLGASAAAAAALRWAAVAPPSPPAPLPMPAPGQAGAVRTGVFVCHCGINIAGTVDVAAVAEAARAMPGVVHAEHNLFTCSSDTQDAIRQRVREHGLTRVVVAACTPRTHEPLFRRTCQEAGLNPYLFEMANIREHCSWVHQHDRAAATRKAVDLVRMAVGRAARLEALGRRSVPVEPRVLVVGGGLAGMHAALGAAEAGRPVTLVERADALGGRVRALDLVEPGGTDARALVGRLERALAAAGVEVMLGSEVRSVGGFVGSFEARVAPAGEAPEAEGVPVRAGAVVLATGTEPVAPPAALGHGRAPTVITNLELEGMLRDPAFAASLPGRRVVMVHCVGAMRRDGTGLTGCSRYCCTATVARALRLRRAGADVTCVTRDVRTYQLGGEDLYREAQEAGVRFLRYEHDYPRVSEDGRRVTVLDLNLGETVALDADLVVLASALGPPAANVRFQDLLKVPLDPLGYFLELHPKLGPSSTNTEGILLAGTARYPADAAEAAAAGRAAAAKALGLTASPVRAVDPVVAVVDPARCWACGRCVDVCQFHAPSIVEGKGPRGTSAAAVAAINEAMCKGCGTCVARCPVGAIAMRHFSDAQLEGALAALLEGGGTR